MQNVENKIKSFQDLVTWQESHKLLLAVYSITKHFPKAEDYALSSQLRRAVISVTSNIAEGFTRDSFADKCHFYIMSHASLTEVQNQLIIARDLGYINNVDYVVIENQSSKCYRLLSGLIKSTKERR